MRPRPGVPLADAIYPLGAGDGSSVGSTDVGTVSWVVPTVQARGATVAIGTPGHSWQLTAQGKAAAAHKGKEHVAKVMESTAADLRRGPDRVERSTAQPPARLARPPCENGSA